MKTPLLIVRNQIMIVLAVLASTLFTGCKEEAPAPNN